MTVNIKGKHIAVGFIVFILIGLGVFGFTWSKKVAYMENVKICQEKIHSLYYMSMLLSAELQDTWSDFIYDDEEYFDENTGEFYVSYKRTDSSYRLENFSQAIACKSMYYSNKGVQKELESLYSETKHLLTEMTPSPKKYTTLHININELFHTAETMYNCAISPEGNLSSYTSLLNQLSTDYKKQSSGIDIQIGEIASDKKKELERSAIKKFF